MHRSTLKRYIPRRVLRYRRAAQSVRNLLLEHGLYRTMVEDRPVHLDGTPIPWFTFGAIWYLDQLDLSSMSLFEYGSGNSTLYWQQRVRSVVSVEDDPVWYQDVSRRLVGGRVDYRLLEVPSAYVDAVRSGVFDIIVVDGSHREDCVAAAIPQLSQRGFVILDNADWYPAQAAELRDAGLIEVDFTGFGPINAYTSTTSVFLQPTVRLRPRADQPVVGPGGMPENVCSTIT